MKTRESGESGVSGYDSGGLTIEGEPDFRSAG